MHARPIPAAKPLGVEHVFEEVAMMQRQLSLKVREVEPAPTPELRETVYRECERCGQQVPAEAEKCGWCGCRRPRTPAGVQNRTPETVTGPDAEADAPVPGQPGSWAWQGEGDEEGEGE